MMTIDDDAIEVLAERASKLLGVTVTEWLKECAAQAIALVTTYTKGASVPGPVLTGAMTEVTAELWNRKDAPNGVKSFADGLDGVSAIRVRRDALAAVKPQLDLYLTPGIA